MLNLKEALSQTRLDELQKVVQKNKDVNDTVGTLMDKWEEIKNFSKIWLLSLSSPHINIKHQSLYYTLQ